MLFLNVMYILSYVLSPAKCVIYKGSASVCPGKDLQIDLQDKAECL